MILNAHIIAHIYVAYTMYNVYIYIHMSHTQTETHKKTNVKSILFCAKHVVFATLTFICSAVGVSVFSWFGQAN